MADVPRGRFPRALRLAAVRLGPSRIVTDPLLEPGVGADLPVKPGAVRPKARGEQAEASSASDKDPRRYPPPGFIAPPQPRRHQGDGSDALPFDGDEGSVRGGGEV